jgi:hypothetical protein
VEGFYEHETGPSASTKSWDVPDTAQLAVSRVELNWDVPDTAQLAVSRVGLNWDVPDTAQLVYFVTYYHIVFNSYLFCLLCLINLYILRYYAAISMLII